MVFRLGVWSWAARLHWVIKAIWWDSLFSELCAIDLPLPKHIRRTSLAAGAAGAAKAAKAAKAAGAAKAAKATRAAMAAVANLNQRVKLFYF